MIKSRKAVIEPFPLLIGVMGSAILLFLVSILMADYAQLKIINPEPLGGKAVEVLDAYQEGDDALAYLDNSAKQSLERGVSYTGEHGFKKIVPPDFRYVLWTSGQGEWDPDERHCFPRPGLNNHFPSERTLREAFDSYFGIWLDRHVRHVNSFNVLSGIKLVNANKYTLTLSRIVSTYRVEGSSCTAFCGLGSGLECVDSGNGRECVRRIPPERLKLVGTTREPVVVDYEKFDYNVTPSFTETLNVDLFEDFENVTGNAAKIFGLDTREELYYYTIQDLAGLLGASIGGHCGRSCGRSGGGPGHLFWNIDGWSTGLGPTVCHDEPCSYTRCTKTCEDCTTDENGKESCSSYCCRCTTFHDTKYWYWTSTVARVSANISTPEVYFWDYDAPQLNDRDYTYKFALKWMGGKGIWDCPPSDCS